MNDIFTQIVTNLKKVGCYFSSLSECSPFLILSNFAHPFPFWLFCVSFEFFFCFIAAGFMQNSFYAAVNHVVDLSGNKCNISARSTGHALVRDWQISIHFACFCFWKTVTIMIEGSVKRNRKFDIKFQSLHVIEKPISHCCDILVNSMSSWSVLRLPKIT